MAGTGFAETTLYECGSAKSGRRDLMRSQRVARPSLERGMEAASGMKRTLQHGGVRKGKETAENPLPATHPIGHPQGGLLSITLYFSNAGTLASAEASAGIRACVGRYVNKDG